MISAINSQAIKNIYFKGIAEKSKLALKTVTRSNYTLESARANIARTETALQRIQTDRRYEQFITKKGKVTLEEYMDIKKKHPEIILRAIMHVSKCSRNGDLKVTPDKAAKLIEMLNFLTEDNATIISVGTSPSFVTEGMKALGKDVIFLPMSGGNWCMGKDTVNDYFEYYPNLKLVGEYLKHQGITPEKLKDKDVIILDYCATGRTLHLIYRLVKEHCKIDEKQIAKESLYDLIKLAYSSTLGSKNARNKNTIKYEDMVNISNDLMYQNIEIASNVPHFSVYNDRDNRKKPYSVSSKRTSKEELFKIFDEYSRPSARAYQLCVLHELDKSGQLKKLLRGKNENQSN